MGYLYRSAQTISIRRGCVLISLEYKFIFVANSKTASTSVESVLAKYADIKEKVDPRKKHQTCSQILNNYKEMLDAAGGADDFFKFGIMRKPIDWLYSWYRYRSGNEGIEAAIDEELSFEEFFYRGDWNIWLDRENKVPRLQSRHFISEIDGDLLVDKILKFENLNHELNATLAHLNLPIEEKLPVKNKSRIEKRLDLSPEFEMQLKRHFSKDIEIYEAL